MRRRKCHPSPTTPRAATSKTRWLQVSRCSRDYLERISGSSGDNWSKAAATLRSSAFSTLNVEQPFTCKKIWTRQETRRANESEGVIKGATLGPAPRLRRMRSTDAEHVDNGTLQMAFSFRLQTKHVSCTRYVWINNGDARQTCKQYLLFCTCAVENMTLEGVLLGY